MTPDKLRGAILRDTTPGGRTSVILDPKIYSGRIQLVDEETGQTRFEIWDDLRKRVGSGAIEIRSTNQASPNHQARTDKDDKKEAEARRWLQAWKDIAKVKNVSYYAAYALLEAGTEEPATGTDKKDKLPDSPKPSLATMYRHLERDADNLPLISSNTEKGNRTARYSDDIREVIADEAHAKYLQPMARWTMLDLVKDINQLLHEKKLLPDEQNVSREYVANVIHQDLTTDVKGARMLGKDRVAARAIAKARIRVSSPLQRVELDAVHLPFVVKTPHGISSEVWLVHAIDCATSIPLGWCLVIGAPRPQDVRKCLERTLFSNKEELKALGINTHIDLFGTPVWLVWDNGPENAKSRFQRLTRIGITPIYCKARGAHGKPYIERHNRSLKEALQKLGGCTRFDGKDGARDPVALGDELITLEELELWILRWKFEKHVNGKLKRLKSAVFGDDFVGQTPGQAYKTLINERQLALPLPPTPSKWKEINREETTCTLNNKTGAQVETFDFAGKNLLELLAIVGETEVTVYYDRDDYRSVWVPIDREGNELELTNKDIFPSSPAYSFAEAKVLRDQKHADPEGEAAAKQFDKDLSARASKDIQGKKAQRKKAQSKREKSKATTQAARLAAAENRAAQRPVNHVEIADPTAPQLPEGLWPTSTTKDFDTIDRANFKNKP